MTITAMDALQGLGFFLLALVGMLLLLLALLRRMRERDGGCAQVPPEIRRQPDPCLYSQQYLASRVPPVPVTWDNPDIWLTEPDGSPVSSAQLAASHDYRVVCRIWNASFYPAFGVRVTCHFVDWGFSPTAEQPVQVDASGADQVVMVDIGPWGKALATFEWRTPAAVGHYCLFVRCAHPDDVTTANNVGQENTRIIDTADAGSSALSALLTNDGSSALRVRFAVDAYQLPGGAQSYTVRQGQRVLSRDRRRPRSADRDGERAHRGAWIRQHFAATGAAVLTDQQRRLADQPAGWRLLIDGQPAERGISLAAGERRVVALELQTAPGTPPQPAVNVTAWGSNGRLLGGVTLQPSVKG